ncbi:hypothetical protein BB559_007160 [Furculomyces boomerangus]|uniref:Guided entry of tail-anchored proteins 1 n=3 Tax=Harpellales TaxID=61421 RepID=A0A2T9XYJ5_9FUNG|nr:hypothetical protein BB559_007160 [Furculomyces boomerangus]PVZ97377.1 hypothetical protein BB558_006663 [Smittium angustum]
MNVCIGLGILFIELLFGIIGFIGYNQTSDMIYKLWCRIVSDTRAKEREETKREIQKLRSEIRTISSVDEFSKWAKLKRKLDAASKRFETKNSEYGIHKASFSIKANIALFGIVYGVRTLIVLLYYRTPVMEIPSAWLYPFGWILSYPGAPAGSVSVGSWSFICNRICNKLIKSFDNLFPTVKAGEPVGAVLADTNRK